MTSEENFDVELFIDAIKNYPEIWNISFEMYHDRVKKRSAWIKICEMFSEAFLEKDDREKNEICNKFIKKWRNIKDSFLKNLKKKTTSGQAADSGRTYIYAKQLSFLKQTATTSETQSSLPEERQDVDQGQESSELAEGDPGPSHRPSDDEHGRKNKATKRSIEQSLIQYMNTPMQIPASTVETNPDRAFFESILPSIEPFTEDQKLDFRCEVLNIVKRMRVATQTTPPMSRMPYQYHPPHFSVHQAATYQPLYPAPPILTELQVRPPSATDSAHTVQPSPTWTSPSGSQTEADEDFDIFNN